MRTERIIAREVLDPRDNPTVEVELWLEIDGNFALHVPEVLRVDHHHVPYDSQAVARHIHDLALPGAYDTFLGASGTMN